MSLPDGAEYVIGSARKLVTLADGSIVTRSAAENVFAQSKEGGGFATEYARKKVMRAPAFRAAKLRPSYAKNFKEAQQATGISQREYDALYAKVKANQKDNSPNGPKAKWLVAMGRRNDNWDHSPGESPSIF